MNVKNVLFDFNGTIVNDLDLCLNLLNTMLKMRNHETVSLENYLNIFDFPVIEYYKKAGLVFPEDNFPVLAEFFIKEYKENNKYCPLHDGVEEVLAILKSKGLKLYIVSASEINLLNDQLKLYNIHHYFDGVSGLDNINASSKIESAKMFVEKLNLNKEETIFVGDTLHDGDVGDVLGVKTILLSIGHQSRERLLKSNKQVCSSFKDLLAYLNSEV